MYTKKALRAKIKGQMKLIAVAIASGLDWAAQHLREGLAHLKQQAKLPKWQRSLHEVGA